MANEDQPWLNDPIVKPTANQDQPWMNDPIVHPPMLNPDVTGGAYPRAQIREDSGPGVVRSVSESIRSGVLGEGRMEDPSLPDIGVLAKFTPMNDPLGDLPMGNKVAISSGISAASDPQQVIDIALENLPGSSLRDDAMGNPIIDWNGQSFYAWKPGFRRQDARRLAAQGAAYTGAAKLGTSMGSGILSRVLGVMGLSGGTSAGLDLAAGQAGSEQGISKPRAVMAAGLGGMAEMLQAPASAVARRLSSSGVDDAEIARILRERGIDPDSLSTAQAREFGRMARDAVNPEDAGRVAESQSLPVPVRETRGSATLDPSAQMFENQAAEGVYGSAAQSYAKGAQELQKAQIRENVPAIQERIAGGAPNVVERGQGGAMAQAGLLQKKARFGKAVDTLYDKARATPAAVAAEGVDELAGKINAAGGDFVRLVPEVNDMVAQLRALADEGDVAAETLFDWRSRVSKLSRASANPQQGAGLKSILGAFDEHVSDTVKDHLLAGNEKAARAWLKAINARRGLGKIYESNDLIADLVEREYAAGGQRLKVAPESAANLIFGKADLGFMTKPELGRELTRLRKVLGAKSPEWAALREEAFLRFASKLEGAFEGGRRGVSGAGFLKAWEDGLRKNPTVIRSLFTEPERNLITQFGRVAARMTSAVRGGRNYSGTSHGLAEIGKRLAGSSIMGPKIGAFLGDMFPQIKNAIEGAKVRRGIENVIPKRQISAGIVPAVGAIAGRESGNRLMPQRPPSQ